MKTIQFILVPLIIASVIIYFMRWRSKLLDRGIVFSIGILAVLMILIPDLTQNIAHWVGVGRGADLITYVGLTGLSFFCMLLFSHLRETQQNLTAIAREVAIQNAKKPNRL